MSAPYSPSPAATKPKRKGNYVAGPGRPRGGKNKVTKDRDAAIQAVAEKIGQLLPGVVPDAHDVLKAIYQDDTLPLLLRMEAASRAVRYERPALLAAAIDSAAAYKDRLAERLDAACTRMGIPTEAVPLVMLPISGALEPFNSPQGCPLPAERPQAPLAAPQRLSAPQAPRGSSMMQRIPAPPELASIMLAPAGISDEARELIGL